MIKTLQVTILLILLGCTIAAQDWELHSDHEGIQVYTLEQADTKIQRLRATVTIEATLEQAINAQLDVEQMPSWYDRIAEVRLKHTRSPVDLDISVLISLPWPLKDRFTTLAATGYMDPENKSLHISTKYLPSRQGIPEDVVLVTEIGSSWTIKQVDDSQIFVDHEVYLDPGGVLPAWLINLTSTEGPRKTLEGFRKIVPTYSSHLSPELEALR
jgi:hypothetical protein